MPAIEPSTSAYSSPPPIAPAVRPRAARITVTIPAM
jgi:hypothetical protein